MKLQPYNSYFYLAVFWGLPSLNLHGCQTKFLGHKIRQTRQYLFLGKKGSIIIIFSCQSEFGKDRAWNFTSPPGATGGNLGELSLLFILALCRLLPVFLECRLQVPERMGYARESLSWSPVTIEEEKIIFPLPFIVSTLLRPLSLGHFLSG